MRSLAAAATALLPRQGPGRRPNASQPKQPAAFPLTPKCGREQHHASLHLPQQTLSVASNWRQVGKRLKAPRGRRTLHVKRRSGGYC